MSAATEVEVDGRRIRLTNLDKVLYPEVGYTKAEVIDYYARVAPTMLTHLADRLVTFRRYPDGVEGESFFEKRCPSHRPPWVETATGPGSRDGPVDYCVLDEVAAIVWAANLAAIELHTPMGRVPDQRVPTMVVFDLDPGAPAAMAECCQVAVEIRSVLEGVGLEMFPKTSGSKGLQLYVPLNTPASFEQSSSFALAVAQLLEKQQPERVTSTMAKKERTGKVFIDWSQNSWSKTTVCAYSMRALPRPTVSTPVTWEEVDAAASGRPLSFETDEVLDRLGRMGDLFEPTASMEQRLPAARRS
ncbi:MAG: Multifunctional non-homologous end joining protein LigD [Acidimicrobiales bacterium]|nr:Multifunctional non-homologous end joining protein LigD [Acidimicrobiales bacterium]